VAPILILYGYLAFEIKDFKSQNAHVSLVKANS
jgi:hypothetical protein